LEAAERVSAALGDVEHKLVRLNLDSIGGSALTDDKIAVPEEASEGIPVTYVPARNTVFLSIALGWAEVLGATDIFIGVNAVDYSGYPDCRPAFIDAFEQLANVATRVGVEGGRYTVHTPLMALGKDDIVKLGARLGVDYSQTVSCYQATDDGLACGRCDACRLRREGFAKANLEDVTRYVPDFTL
jgi:7-cyano-7-deazaguanine synthase